MRCSRCWFIITALSLLLFGTALCTLAQAAGPVVGPQKCEFAWAQSPTNANGTPLTDLLGWKIYTTITPGNYTGAAPLTLLNAAAPNPSAVVNMVYDCKAAPFTDGQRYVTVTAVDQALNESARSNEAPFVFDKQTPSTPTGLIAQ
jgi:hypothetical protein